MELDAISLILLALAIPASFIVSAAAGLGARTPNPPTAPPPAGKSCELFPPFPTEPTSPLPLPPRFLGRAPAGKHWQRDSDNQQSQHSLSNQPFSPWKYYRHLQ